MTLQEEAPVKADLTIAEECSLQTDRWRKNQLLYRSALKEIGTKIDVLNSEFVLSHNYNPIEHVSQRIKTVDSITRKLKRLGYEPTMDNMDKYLFDIAGIRIICSFTSDIYRIAGLIARQDDVAVIRVKDYLKNPKENGYKSFHMIMNVPIYLSTGTEIVNVEIQIRTIAMDFWASLEHKIYYKFEGNAPQHIYDELKNCAEIVDGLDKRMLALNEEIQQIKATSVLNENTVGSEWKEKTE